MSYYCPIAHAYQDWEHSDKQLMSGDIPPMPLECTICTAMFGSGAAIGGTKTTRAHQLTEVSGKLAGKLAQIICGWCVAVPGPPICSSAAVPGVAGLRWTIATHSVFALLWFLRSLRFSVLCCSLPRSSVPFYPLCFFFFHEGQRAIEIEFYLNLKIESC